jgi:hypothetical protein
MPAEWVAQALKGRQIDVVDGDGVSKLANEFGVSQQAMMYRLVNLGYAENL